MDCLWRIITRLLISLFHISSGVASGACFIYTLARWGTMEKCIPPMVQLTGRPLTMETQFPKLCDGVYSALLASAFIHLAMCALVNAFWKRRSKCVLLIHLVVSLAIAVFLVFVASSMTTYRMIWCDVMIQRISEGRDNMDCASAANEYCKQTGSRNMTRFHDRIELQMIGLWSLVPLAIVMVFLYGIAMTLQRSDRSSDTSSSQPQGGRPGGAPSDAPIDPEETSPLVVNSNGRSYSQN